MTHGLIKRHRRSIRLKGYDYSQAGAYFVTLCAQDRACLFGEVVDGQMRLNEAGRIVEQCWLEIPNHFPHVDLDAFVAMPNHVHGIIVLENRAIVRERPSQRAMAVPEIVGARHAVPLPMRQKERFGQPVPGSVPTILRSFKSAVTKRINDHRHTPGASVWQRNYYEHVIRDEKSLDCIREYICQNPLRWEIDRDNPNATHPEPEDAWRD